MLKHLNIKIFGLVQGVFFRDAAKEKADKLNIYGFVKNESNGTVYIEAEGEEENLKEFLNWCRVGPASSQVEKVEFEFSGHIMNFSDFIIIIL